MANALHRAIFGDVATANAVDSVCFYVSCAVDDAVGASTYYAGYDALVTDKDPIGSHLHVLVTLQDIERGVRGRSP